MAVGAGRTESTRVELIDAPNVEVRLSLYDFDEAIDGGPLVFPGTTSDDSKIVNEHRGSFLLSPACKIAASR